MNKKNLAVQGLMLSIVLGGCKTIRPYEINPNDVQHNAQVKEFAVGGETGQVNWVAHEGRFKTALMATSSNPTDADPAIQYLEAGVAVADLYCRRFLKNLGEQQADNQAARGAFNVVDAATSAALGLAGAPTGVVSGASLGFSSVEAIFENLDSAYLVSPEVEQVEALVFAARDTLHEEIFSEGPESYYEAERRLGAYHNLCTFNGIKRVVNEAVASGVPVITNDETSALEALRAFMSQADDGDGVSPLDGGDAGGFTPPVPKSRSKSLVVRIR